MLLHNAINRAISLWVEATGVDPDKTVFHGFYEIDIRQRHGVIREAQDLDAALTTFMILRSSAREFAKEVEFDALEFLERPEKVLEGTVKLRELLRVLNDPDCMAQVREFQAQLHRAAQAAGLDGVCGKVIDDIQELAYIRRDALRGHRSLETHHFSAGKRGTAPAKYNPGVIKFWNMNSVIAAARVQPEDGVMLAMVRDPVALCSFFAFVVRNGENIAVLTDADRGTHPLQKYMSRGGSTANSYGDRAFRLRFPYQLFEFEFNEKGRFVRERMKTTLVPINTEAVRVKPIGELEPDQALWILMMFDLIKEVHWRQEPQPVVLSYTGEGMVAGALPAPKDGTLIVPGKADVAPLRRGDMTRGRLGENWERERTGQNDWMEDRYADRVPESVFNIVGDGGPHRLLDGTGVDPRKLIPKVPKDAMPDRWVGNEEQKHPLATVEPTWFGRPEQMEADRRFVARYNQATVVQALANAEFMKRKDEILRWYEDRVRANTAFLLDAAARGTLVSEVQGQPPGEEHSFDYGHPQPGEILELRNSPGRRNHEYPQVKLYTFKGGRYLCHLNGNAVSVWADFRPWTPVSLAVLAGCRVGDLPDVLRHWTLHDRYEGNSILDRIDPMEWRCENPWRKLAFDVGIGLSKSAFNRLRRGKGLPFMRFGAEA